MFEFTYVVKGFSVTIPLVLCFCHYSGYGFLAQHVLQAIYVMLGCLSPITLEVGLMWVWCFIHVIMLVSFPCKPACSFGFTDPFYA